MTETIILSIFIVIMNNLYELNKLIEKYSSDLRGVFSISDLKNLFNDFNDISFYRKIKKLETNKILTRFVRGFYVDQNFDIEVLSSRINEDSYISFANILAKELLIGSIPKYTLSCVKLGRKRSYTHDGYKINYLSISPQLYFGYYNKNAIFYAQKEKALLDTLYYYQKGRRFSFNLFTDINYRLLDLNLLNEYLKKYNNPKFISFVEGLINEKI